MKEDNSISNSCFPQALVEPAAVRQLAIYAPVVWSSEGEVLACVCMYVHSKASAVRDVIRARVS